MRPLKPYSELILADESELTDEEVHRKQFCESLPDTVVTALVLRAEALRKEVMRIEQERDEIIDFLNGYCWRDFSPFEYPKKDGDAE